MELIQEELSGVEFNGMNSNREEAKEKRVGLITAE